MANLYEMYYAQAMNHKLYKENNPQANEWADKVEQAFRRDAELCREYNEEMSGGKWNGMMTQKHIGYTSWNDDFPADRLPEVYRIEQPEGAVGGYLFTGDKGWFLWRRSITLHHPLHRRPPGQSYRTWDVR